MTAPVLVVEDDLGCAERLRGAIREMGGSAHIVTDGLEALRWLRSARPALILVDQGASWVDGFRLCRLVKFHGKMRQIPVLIMTAVPDVEHQRLAEAVKADGYVEKRQNLQPVLEAVRRLLAAEGAAEGGG